MQPDRNQNHGRGKQCRDADGENNFGEGNIRSHIFPLSVSYGQYSGSRPQKRSKKPPIPDVSGFLIVLCLCNVYNGQGIIADPEPDIVSCEGQTIDPVRFSLIGRSGVVGENTDSGISLVSRKPEE